MEEPISIEQWNRAKAEFRNTWRNITKSRKLFCWHLWVHLGGVHHINQELDMMVPKRISRRVKQPQGILVYDFDLGDIVSGSYHILYKCYKCGKYKIEGRWDGV